LLVPRNEANTKISNDLNNRNTVTLKTETLLHTRKKDSGIWWQYLLV